MDDVVLDVAGIEEFGDKALQYVAESIINISLLIKGIDYFRLGHRFDRQ